MSNALNRLRPLGKLLSSFITTNGQNSVCHSLTAASFELQVRL